MGLSCAEEGQTFHFLIGKVLGGEVVHVGACICVCVCVHVCMRACVCVHV